MWLGALQSPIADELVHSNDFASLKSETRRFVALLFAFIVQAHVCGFSRASRAETRINIECDP